MNKVKKYVRWTAGVGFLMTAGSLFQATRWIAKAAPILSQPVSNVKEAYFPVGSFRVGGTGYLESCLALPGGVCPALMEN